MIQKINLVRTGASRTADGSIIPPSAILNDTADRSRRRSNGVKSKRIRLGPIGRKILLCLATGAALSFTGRPDRYFKILNAAAKEWKKIDERSLRFAIQKLYQSNLVQCSDRKDGTTEITLSSNGKARILIYNLENIAIKKQEHWDGLWRIVIFDIPEHQKQARDALSFKLKQMGMLPIQKSVFISPFDCHDEIDFIIETFAVKPHVRYIVAKEIDIARELKAKFKIA